MNAGSVVVEAAGCVEGVEVDELHAPSMIASNVTATVPVIASLRGSHRATVASRRSAATAPPYFCPNGIVKRTSHTHWRR